MSAVVDMILKPIVMAGEKFPFFSFPPTNMVCGIVELIKGGQIEEIPGIGQILKYGRETVLVILLLIVLYIKAWQYIGPKLWHWIEGGKNWAREHLTEGEPNSDDYDFFPNILKIILWWGVTIFITGPLTYLIQVPIDIMSWDLESLSLDFGHKWGDKSNAFRSGCDRFVNGSYAADYSLYEGETISDFNSHGYEIQSLQYEHSPDKYLCTHGNYCKEVSDIFGQTGLGNASYTISPTNGYVNGINVSSAPRKYSVCCSGTPLTNCDEHCREDSPIDIDDLKNPWSLITDLEEMVLHPINTIEELLDIFLPPALNRQDYEAVECNFKNAIYDWWKGACTGTLLICPDTVDFHRDNCTESWSDIARHIREAYHKRLEHCQNVCKSENDQILLEYGCNSEYMDQAKRSTERKHCDILYNRLNIVENTEDQFKSVIKRRTPWISGEVESVSELLSNELDLNNKDVDSYNRDRLNQCSQGLTIEVNGRTIDCSKKDLSESDSDKCFGPFRPWTWNAFSYPQISWKIFKDFVGPMLKIILIMIVIFIILCILCLFNPIGIAAYKLNKNAGMIGEGMENMGMKNLNIDNVKNMIK